MGLFHRNNGATASGSPSGNVMDSLQNREQERGVIVKRDPCENFNWGSVVIVNPGETAIFEKNGQRIGVLTSGRHELSTENYPFLSAIRNTLTGGKTTFPCRIYYVRATDIKIEWGTPNGIQYQDNYFEIPSVARGYGSYYITFSNLGMFEEKVMGNLLMFTEGDLQNFFRDNLESKMASLMSERLGEMTKGRKVLAINDIKDEFTGAMTEDMGNLLDGYGLSLERFVIGNFSIDEDETRLDSIRREADWVARKHNYGGDFNKVMMEKMIEDPSGNGMGNMAAGLGMAMAMGNAFANMAQGAMGGQQQQQQQTQVPDPVESLKKMKAMLDAGLITQDIYDTKVAEIMARL